MSHPTNETSDPTAPRPPSPDEAPADASIGPSSLVEVEELAPDGGPSPIERDRGSAPPTKEPRGEDEDEDEPEDDDAEAATPAEAEAVGTPTVPEGPDDDDEPARGVVEYSVGNQPTHECRQCGRQFWLVRSRWEGWRRQIGWRLTTLLRRDR